MARVAHDPCPMCSGVLHVSEEGTQLRYTCEWDCCSFLFDDAVEKDLVLSRLYPHKLDILEFKGEVPLCQVCLFRGSCEGRDEERVACGEFFYDRDV